LWVPVTSLSSDIVDELFEKNIKYNYVLKTNKIDRTTQGFVENQTSEYHIGLMNKSQNLHCLWEN
jgi:hypothetical protein